MNIGKLNSTYLTSKFSKLLQNFFFLSIYSHGLLFLSIMTREMGKTCSAHLYLIYINGMSHEFVFIIFNVNFSIVTPYVLPVPSLYDSAVAKRRAVSGYR